MKSCKTLKKDRYYFIMNNYLVPDFKWSLIRTKITWISWNTYVHVSLITTIGLDLHNQCIPEKIKMYCYTLTSAKKKQKKKRLIFLSFSFLWLLCSLASGCGYEELFKIIRSIASARFTIHICASTTLTPPPSSLFLLQIFLRSQRALSFAGPWRLQTSVETPSPGKCISTAHYFLWSVWENIRTGYSQIQ